MAALPTRLGHSLITLLRSLRRDQQLIFELSSSGTSPKLFFTEVTNAIKCCAPGLWATRPSKMRYSTQFTRFTRTFLSPKLVAISRSRSVPVSTFYTSPRMASTLPKTPIFTALSKHSPESLAIIHSVSERTFCYGSLLHDVAAIKDKITELAGGRDLKGERIAFLAENGYDYVGE